MYRYLISKEITVQGCGALCGRNVGAAAISYILNAFQAIGIIRDATAQGYLFSRTNPTVIAKVEYKSFKAIAKH